MADGYLEKHQRDYEIRKAAWQCKKRHLPKAVIRPIKPDDEAL